MSNVLLYLLLFFPCAQQMRGLLSEIRSEPGSTAGSLEDRSPTKGSALSLNQLRRLYSPFARFYSDSNATLNRIIGQPKAVCGLGAIGVQFETYGPFNGRVFTSHHSDSSECLRYYQNATKVRFELPLSAAQCGVVAQQARRENSSAEYEVKVVVSYGRWHLSEDDRILSVHCSFRSYEQNVGTSYSVGVFLSHRLSGIIPPPKCKYSLHAQSLNGPTPLLAQIGDTIYHKWSCETDYNMVKVYECYVHDGRQQKFLLVDDKGCSVDESIIPNLVYDRATGIAYTKSRVFKFTESTQMFFNCLLYVCPLSDPICAKEAPVDCEGSRNRKRREDEGDETVEITANLRLLSEADDERPSSSETMVHIDPQPMRLSGALQPSISWMSSDATKASCVDILAEALMFRRLFVALTVSNFVTVAIAAIAFASRLSYSCRSPPSRTPRFNVRSFH